LIYPRIFAILEGDRMKEYIIVESAQ
jgi:hypothetical protein